jgi:hypothetical protein
MLSIRKPHLNIYLSQLADKPDHIIVYGEPLAMCGIQTLNNSVDNHRL